MRVLVCGGRNYNDYDRVCEVLDDVLASSPDGHVTIINGAARGADQLSTRWAKERGEEFVECPADWDAYGKAAGPLRNAAMLDRWHPDMGAVFPGGSGTEDMLCRLFRAGVETRVVGR
jgi:hypothetical protein